MKTTTNNTFRPAAQKFGVAAIAVSISLLAYSFQTASAHHTDGYFDSVYGDNASDWAFDGECDDPRFAGPGTAYDLYWEDAFHDAADCRRLHRIGDIWFR